MNPQCAYVAACLCCFFFSFKADLSPFPHLPTFLTPILLKAHSDNALSMPFYHCPPHGTAPCFIPLSDFLSATEPGSNPILSPLHPTPCSPCSLHSLEWKDQSLILMVFQQLRVEQDDLPPQAEQGGRMACLKCCWGDQDNYPRKDIYCVVR